MAFSIQIGQVVTSYSTIALRVERIERGGMGLVLIGPNVLDGDDAAQQWYALKTMTPALLDRVPILREQFLQEALTWNGLWPHPNILTAHGLTEIDGLPFLILDYASHGSLRSLLKVEQPFESRLVWVQHAAAGLLALHTPDPKHLRNAPLIHRDLKPSNILVDEQGYALLTDFGLTTLFSSASPRDSAFISDRDEGLQVAGASVVPHRSQRAKIIGSPAYVAPELWDGVTEAGPASDLYAFGLILSELLVGRYPYDLRPHMTLSAWHRVHHQTQPYGLKEWQPILPEPIEQLYQGLIAKRPEDRPTAREALKELGIGAHALGLEIYQPREIYAHTDEHERIHWRNWANVYARFGLYAEALIRIDRAYALSSQDIDVLLTRGNILKGLHRRSEAQECYRRVLHYSQAEPSQLRRGTYNQLGLLYQEQGAYAQAEEAYEQALTITPDAADTWYNRANNQCLWAQTEQEDGNAAQSLQHFQLALESANQAQTLGLNHPHVQDLIDDLSRYLSV
jgi:serine/threonine protein kinase